MKELAKSLSFLPAVVLAGSSASLSGSPSRSHPNPPHSAKPTEPSRPFGEQLLDQLPSTSWRSVAMRSGQQILRAGDSLRYIYIVRTGYLKTEYALPNGQYQVTQFIKPTDCFGIDGIANGSHYLNWVALCEGSLIRIDYSQLQQHLQTNPGIQLLLDKIMSEGWIKAQDHVFSLGAHTSEQKLAYFLLDFYRDQDNQELVCMQLPMGREDLGSYLGVTVECLSRCFTNLERYQLLHVSNRLLSELNVEGLVKLLFGLGGGRLQS